MPTLHDAGALHDALVAGDRAAIAAALNAIDDRRPAARDTTRALFARLARSGASERALRIGLTGPPGAGKSTLADALVRTLRAQDKSVGIIAVDPSSKQSGGALLGDRVRVRAASRDPGVFLRSMAARDRLGGLSDASYPSLELLAAAFDFVLVETVGVGQSETDIASLVDTLVFVLQPGAGDMMQFMKAGVLELPDVFAVNKADQGAMAERTASELQAGLGLGTRRDAGWTPPALLVSARDGRGIDELLATLEAHRAHLAASEQLVRRRRHGRTRFTLDALARRYGSHGLAQLGGADALEARLEREPGESLWSDLEAYGEAIEKRLRGASS